MTADSLGVKYKNKEASRIYAPTIIERRFMIFLGAE